MEGTNIFLDEIEKLSGKKMTDQQMREFVSRADPEKAVSVRSSSGKDLKASYREARFNPYQGLPVPLTERLKNYKLWKETGHLPEMESHVYPGDKPFLGAHIKPHVTTPEHVRASGMKYTRSDEPVTVYSGGTEHGLSQAVRKPLTPLDEKFLIPGETQATFRGLYTSPSPDVASQYAGRSSSGMGSRGSAVAKLQVPRKHVVEMPHQTTVSGPSVSQGFRRPLIRLR